MTTTSTSTVRRFFGLLGWILLVPSVLSALGAAWMLASGLGMLGGTHTATGRVVAHQDVTVGTSTRRGFARHSIVEFVAADGRTHRFTDGVARRNQAVHQFHLNGSGHGGFLVLQAVTGAHVDETYARGDGGSHERPQQMENTRNQ